MHSRVARQEQQCHAQRQQRHTEGGRGHRGRGPRKEEAQNETREEARVVKPLTLSTGTEAYNSREPSPPQMDLSISSCTATARFPLLYRNLGHCTKLFDDHFDLSLSRNIKPLRSRYFAGVAKISRFHPHVL